MFLINDTSTLPCYYVSFPSERGRGGKRPSREEERISRMRRGEKMNDCKDLEEVLLQVPQALTTILLSRLLKVCIVCSPEYIRKLGHVIFSRCSQDLMFRMLAIERHLLICIAIVCL